jgi:aryl-alcohol dehydrogenase-like predicted oxidoreductase
MAVILLLMKYRKLGTSDVSVSEISTGCWTKGGLNWVNGKANGWARVDSEEVVQAIKLAVDYGMNHFDKADVYGNGRAERMLAEDLAGLALNYLLAEPVVGCVIPGFRNERQVRCNLAGVGRTLSSNDVAFVRAVPGT